MNLGFRSTTSFLMTWIVRWMSGSVSGVLGRGCVGFYDFV